MKKKVTQILSIALCMVLLFGSTVTANAAKTSSNTSAYQAVFDAEYYYNSNPDLQAAFGYDAQKLFNHFVSSGIYEGRSGCANFNVAIYRANYPDLQAAFGNDLASYCAHYAANGAAEGRNATTLISAGEGAQAAIVRGSCTTKFDPRASRATNIAVAASRINGVVIQPGEEFSFNKTILPRTAANGYVEAPIYVSGKHSTGTGGGICQVSSTMYSAMLNGGIPATERHPHSLPVPYLPEGRDATIAGNYYDLRFVNIYNTPLQISAVADLRTKVMLTIQGEKKEYPAGTSFLRIAQDYSDAYQDDIVLVLYNRRLRELNKCADGDGTVEFLTTADKTGKKAYRRSVTLLMQKAVYNLWGKGNISVRVKYSIGQGNYCELVKWENDTEEVVKVSGTEIN